MFSLLITLAIDLESAVSSYKVAMRDIDIQKNKVHYFEVASIYIRLGRHQVVDLPECI